MAMHGLTKQLDEITRSVDSLSVADARAASASCERLLRLLREQVPARVRAVP